MATAKLQRLRRRDGRRRGPAGTDTDVEPSYRLATMVRIPQGEVNPLTIVYRRVGIAFAALLVSTFFVYLNRNGYQDVRGEPMTLLDCLYHSAITLSTTGYGDVTPVTEIARLTDIMILTPLRMMFLILLVGTTFEVFAEASRQALKIDRWRKKVRDHTIVVGYGTKGRTAVAAMLSDGSKPADIVVVDSDPAVLELAKSDGLVTVRGDGTRSEVLRKALVERARSVVVATSDDKTSVMVTLTAHEIAPQAEIVASVREAENKHLLEQSGADSVVVSSETAGRLLGIATTTPQVVEVIEDLLTPEEGFAITEREVEDNEVGGSPRHLANIVLAVVRDGALFRVDDPEVDAIERGDRLLYVRSVRTPE